jgi:hypothetical protein
VSRILLVTSALGAYQGLATRTTTTVGVAGSLSELAANVEGVWNVRPMTLAMICVLREMALVNLRGNSFMSVPVVTV